MNKKLILVAAPAACGKNHVSEMICRAIDGISYFDKDDLFPMVRNCFELCGEKIDFDGEFYLNNIREHEYKTLFELAFSALRFSELVLVNAPLLREVRDKEYMHKLKERAASEGAKLILVWINTPIDVCYNRMKERASYRDLEKLKNWNEYLEKTDFSAPTSCEVDELIVFKNTDDKSAQRSLEEVLNILGE